MDRCLVAAYDAGIEPLLIVTKTDLADPAAFLAGYEALEVRTVGAAPGHGRRALEPLLRGARRSWWDIPGLASPRW